MITMITIILGILVAINFLLLKFSCNKTNKTKSVEKPVIIRNTTTVATESSVGRLAPTGS